MQNFSVDERRNWGYWDGVAARKRGRLPEWTRGRAHIHRCRHPHDRAYGEAFWAGYYGDDHPNLGRRGFSEAVWRSDLASTGVSGIV